MLRSGRSYQALPKHLFANEAQLAVARGILAEKIG